MDEKAATSRGNVTYKGRKHESLVSAKNTQDTVERGGRRMHPERSSAGFWTKEAVEDFLSGRRCSHFHVVNHLLTKTMQRWSHALFLILA